MLLTVYSHSTPPHISHCILQRNIFTHPHSYLSIKEGYDCFTAVTLVGTRRPALCERNCTNASSRTPALTPTSALCCLCSHIHLPNGVASHLAPSVGDNENIVRVFAMDSTLPTRPIMMEAGCGDMFDIVVNDAMSMQTKIRQGQHENIFEVVFLLEPELFARPTFLLHGGM